MRSASQRAGLTRRCSASASTHTPNSEIGTAWFLIGLDRRRRGVHDSDIGTEDTDMGELHQHNDDYMKPARPDGRWSHPGAPAARAHGAEQNTFRDGGLEDGDRG